MTKNDNSRAETITLENFKDFLAPIIAGLILINNLITVVEGFATGKIKSYSRSINFRLFGEKPIREFSLNFETTYFWIEVGFNMFYVLIGAVVIYFTILR